MLQLPGWMFWIVVISGIVAIMAVGSSTVRDRAVSALLWILVVLVAVVLSQAISTVEPTPGFAMTMEPG